MEATITRPSDFDIMSQHRVNDRASFVRIAEAISGIALPVAMTGRGEKLMDDIRHELHELENSIFERIQKI